MVKPAGRKVPCPAGREFFFFVPQHFTNPANFYKITINPYSHATPAAPRGKGKWGAMPRESVTVMPLRLLPERMSQNARALQGLSAGHREARTLGCFFKKGKRCSAFVCAPAGGQTFLLM